MCNWILVTRDPSLLASIIRHGFLTTFCILGSFQEYARWCSSNLLLPFIAKQLLIQSDSVKYNVSSLKELWNNTVITQEKQIESMFIILVLWFFSLWNHHCNQPVFANCQQTARHHSGCWKILMNKAQLLPITFIRFQKVI